MTKPYSLKINLNTCEIILEDGFDVPIQTDDRARLSGQAGYCRGSLRFYVFGSLYKWHSERELCTWLDRFAPERIASWAAEADGDFVVIVIDSGNKAVYLISDRNGQYRAYYSCQAGVLFISNSLLALSKLLQSPSLSAYSVYQLLTLTYVVDPYSLMTDCYVSMPGDIVIFRQASVQKVSYYEPVNLSSKYFKTDDECVEMLDQALRDVFSKRLSGDRSPCVLLSGGIDSVTMLKYATELSPEPVRTITFSMPNLQPNDLAPARMAAQHFASLHYELLFDAESAVEGYIQAMALAETSNYHAILMMGMRDRLEEVTEGSLDVFAGQDTRLHTPPFDLAKQLGIRLNRGELNWPYSNLLLLMGRAFRGWRGFKSGFFNYFGGHLDLQSSFHEYFFRKLSKYNNPLGWDPSQDPFIELLINQLPPIMPEDDIQVLFKKYVSFEYKTQYTDDMNLMSTSFEDERVRMHHPFYDWQFVEVCNRVPYHLGVRPVYSVHTGSLIPSAGKPVLRSLLRGSVPAGLLYRRKSTAPSIHLLFNGQLRLLVDAVIETWGNNLLEGLPGVIRQIISAVLAAYRSRSSFKRDDEVLLWSVYVISYLCIMNRAFCCSASFDINDALRDLWAQTEHGHID